MAKTINQLTAVAAVANADEVEVQKSGESVTKKATVQQLTQVEADRSETEDGKIREAIGLLPNGYFDPDGPIFNDSWYLKNAQFTAGLVDMAGAENPVTVNIINSIRMLDAALHNSVAQLGASTKTIDIILTPSDILLLSTIPKVLLPALTVSDDYIYEIYSVMAVLIAGSVPYDCTSPVEIVPDGNLFTLPISLMNSSSHAVYKPNQTESSFIGINVPVVITTDSNPTVGNGSLRLSLTYRLHRMTLPIISV